MGRCASLTVQLRLAATADARFSDRPLDACHWAFALATMHCKSSPRRGYWRLAMVSRHVVPKLKNVRELAIVVERKVTQTREQNQAHYRSCLCASCLGV